VSLLCYCRAGFEPECASELIARARAERLELHPHFAADTGYVVAASPADEQALSRAFPWRELIFARQALVVFAHFPTLSRSDRLGPIRARLQERGEVFRELWVESPDSPAGKPLAALCRGFAAALRAALAQDGRLAPTAPRRLHVFFSRGDEAFLATALPEQTAPWPQGVPRLKFPRDAPSRATLKLEEALLVLLDAEQRARWLRPGMHAVDLGAAPGGWTYQLVRRAMRVTAVDNGAIDRRLLASGLVTHRREDGFRFCPPRPVDWLVCDIVERPRRVAELVARWLAEGRCRHALFNLKLPMKQRYDEAMRCLDLVRAAARQVRAKQLYHDRIEITVFATRH
jgi:23S rRNA (cytidine2498-2'-O)-methyltransferase